MPVILTKVGFRINEKIEDSVLAGIGTSDPARANTFTNLITTKEIKTSLSIIQFEKILETLIYINQILAEAIGSIAINQIKAIKTDISLNIFNDSLEKQLGIYIYDVLKQIGILNAKYMYYAIVNQTATLLAEERHIVASCPTYNSISGALLVSGSLEAIDESGPRLSGLIPGSGSVYNNPLTTVRFYLYDQEETPINKKSININIDGHQIIENGEVVVLPAVGIAGLLEREEIKYEFVFNTRNPYSPDLPIVVSGELEDEYSPVNKTNFSYSFRSWKTEDIEGNIVGGKDEDSPYLTNLNPGKYQVEVPADITLIIEIMDDHTGVDFETVEIFINGESVISGGMPYMEDKYNINSTVTQLGRGIRFSIDPVYNFDFKSLVNISVYAEDKFKGILLDTNEIAVPNILEESYNFLIYDNSYLIVSGLQIYTKDIWTETIDLISYEISQSGVDFRTHFLNTEGTGIDWDESYILYNGVKVSGISYEEILPNSDYLVNFHLTPDYSNDCDLIYHIAKLGAVSGVTIYKDYHNELLWGAEICYDPDKNFEYNEEIPIFIQVCDKGEYPKLDYKFYSVTTAPQPRHNLRGSIQGVDPIYNALVASIGSNNPYFEYGKTMNMELSIKDYAGNILNYAYSFKIEDK